MSAMPSRLQLGMRWSKEGDDVGNPLNVGFSSRWRISTDASKNADKRRYATSTLVMGTPFEWIDGDLSFGDQFAASRAASKCKLPSGADVQSLAYSGSYSISRSCRSS